MGLLNYITLIFFAQFRKVPIEVAHWLGRLFMFNSPYALKNNLDSPCRSSKRSSLFYPLLLATNLAFLPHLTKSSINNLLYRRNGAAIPESVSVGCAIALTKQWEQRAAEIKRILKGASTPSFIGSPPSHEERGLTKSGRMPEHVSGANTREKKITTGNRQTIWRVPATKGTLQ